MWSCASGGLGEGVLDFIHPSIFIRLYIRRLLYHQSFDHLVSTSVRLFDSSSLLFDLICAWGQACPELFNYTSESNRCFCSCAARKTLWKMWLHSFSKRLITQPCDRPRPQAQFSGLFIVWNMTCTLYSVVQKRVDLHLFLHVSFYFAGGPCRGCTKWLVYWIVSKYS